MLMALVPILISTFVATRVISVQLEKDIKRKTHSAADLITDKIDNMENRAALIGEIILSNFVFMQAFKQQDEEQIVKLLNMLEKEMQIDTLLITNEKGELKFSSGSISPNVMKQPDKKRMLVLFEKDNIKKLIAGVGLEIRENDKVVGKIVAGYVVKKEIFQNIEKKMGVDIDLFHKAPQYPKTAKDRGKVVLSIEELISKIYKQGASEYRKDIYHNKLHFYGLCSPLMSPDKKVFGVVFVGIQKTYAFQTAVGQFLVILIFLGVLLSAVIGVLIARSISHPLRKFTLGIRAVARGDLEHQIKIKAKGEIKDLANAFNEMIQQLRRLRHLEEELRRKDRLAALGELAAGVAHEIRNPLVIIKNSAQILEDRFHGQNENKELTQYIIEETDRLNKVVTSFLDFARPQKSNLEISQIAPIIDRTLQMTDMEISKNHIEVYKSFQKNLPSVNVDSEQMHQVFLNLILNAIAAMADGGRLEIKTAVKKDDDKNMKLVKISFKDTGCGISKDAMDKVFNPFFTTKSEGTGLGLAIAHKIIENHNGTIEVESQEGKGSIFSVCIPINSA
jgi:signal transduction histidine kinase